MSLLHSIDCPPSSADQWGNCSGWRMATAGLPDLESDASRAGTAGHWVCEQTLKNLQRKVGQFITAAEFIGHAAPNGVVIDETIAEGAQVFVDEVLSVCWKYDALPTLLIESRLTMPDIHPENWGTCDAALYLPRQGLLFGWDYKAGHSEVLPGGNLQLVDYFKGLATLFGIDGHAAQYLQCSARIVQPFCYYSRGPVKSWDFTLSDLRADWNRLHDMAREADTTPRLSTGTWCRHCKALGRCSATRKARYNFIELANQPFEIDDMTAADLAVERGILQDGLAVANARLQDIEEQLKHRIAAGAADCPLTLESIPGRVKWAVPPAQAKAMFAQFGADIGKDDVLTPGQAIKKVPANIRGHVAKLLKRFTTQGSATKLVPVEESRNARAFTKRG